MIFFASNEIITIYAKVREENCDARRRKKNLCFAIKFCNDEIKRVKSHIVFSLNLCISFFVVLQPQPNFQEDAEIMPCKDFRLFCNKCAELVVPWRKWARRGIAIAALVRGHFELSFRGDISFQFVSWLPMIIIHLNYQLVRNYSKICNLQLNKVIKNISIYLIDVYIFSYSHMWSTCPNVSMEYLEILNES